MKKKKNKVLKMVIVGEVEWDGNLDVEEEDMVVFI